MTGNRNVAFTQGFVLDPGEVVVHGWLALGMRQGGGLVNTDFIKIDGAGKMDFSALGWDTQINSSDTFVGVIDLGTTALLPILNHDSQLSVQVNDDTGVDWAMLSLTVLVDQGAGAADVIMDAGGTAIIDSPVVPVKSLTITDATLRLDPGGDMQVLNDLSATSPAAVLSFGIDSDGSGMIQVDGQADLTGTVVDLERLNGFTPGANQSFDLLTASTVIGTPAVDGSDLSEWTLSIDGGGNGQILRATFIGALTGDLDNDGFVGITDLNIVLGNWNQNVPAGDSLSGDVSGDGFVGIEDLNIVLGNWNANSPPNDQTNIPEPTSLVSWLIPALWRVVAGR